MAEKRKNRIEFEDVEKAARGFRNLVIISLVTLGTGTVVFHYTEGWSWVDSFYFSGVSLTTVGYGDLTPTTDLGKILVVLYLFIGIGIIAALVNNLIKGVAARRQLNNRNKND